MTATIEKPEVMIPGIEDMAHFMCKIRYEPETGYFISVQKGRRIGYVKPKGYRHIWYRGREYQEHRLAWILMNGDAGDLVIDHINQDKADNRTDQSNLQVR